MKWMLPGVSVLLLGVGSLSAHATVAEEPLPPLLTQAGIEQRLDQVVPLGERFQDEQGRERSLAAYLGQRPVLLVPAYYGCAVLCSQILNGLAGSLSGMSLRAGADFQVVVLSFDPQDTPAQAAARKATVLRRYHRSGGEGGWHFLTGREPAIHRLMQAIGYRYAYDPGSGQYIHAAGLAVLTPQGRVASYLLGMDFAPRELRLRLVEAGDGKIGSPLERLLLFCYKYDPRHARYGARVVRAVQTGAVLTLLGLGSLLSFLFMKQRRPSWL
jgi:protein SCO1/2